jgi:hypothetical protein
MQEMVTESCKILQFKYTCEKCDFKSNNKTNYTKHLQTKKHNGYTWLHDGYKKVSYNCKCGKSYKHRQGLCRHKKTCEYVENKDLVVLDKNVQNAELVNEIIQENASNDKNITIHITNNYNTVNSNNNNNNNNNINNKSFSVQNYLNNDCKDAYTVKEVIDKFKCDIMKLPKNTTSFYKTLVDIALKDIPVEKLPIRCSDVKRKSFYGKNEDWEKNYDVQENFVKKLVDSICKLRNHYSNCHPDWHDDDIVFNIMHSIIQNIARIYDKPTCKHISQYIAEKTKITK